MKSQPKIPRQNDIQFTIFASHFCSEKSHLLDSQNNFF